MGEDKSNFVSEATGRLSKLQAAARGGQRNAEGIGAAGAVVLAWVLTTFLDVAIPAEVTIALGTVIGAVTARIKG